MKRAGRGQLRIMWMDEARIGQLAESLGYGITHVSQHLRKLLMAGMVECGRAETADRRGSGCAAACEG